MALAAAPLHRFPAAPPRALPSSRSQRYAPLPPPHSRRRTPLLLAAVAAAPLTAADTEGRKHELLRAVQETQRGSTANSDQRAAIEEAIVCVEELGAGEGAPLDLAALDGTWRLCYTSASDVLMLFEAAEKLPLLQMEDAIPLYNVLGRRPANTEWNLLQCWDILKESPFVDYTPEAEKRDRVRQAETQGRTGGKGGYTGTAGSCGYTGTAGSCGTGYPGPEGTPSSSKGPCGGRSGSGSGGTGPKSAQSLITSGLSNECASVCDDA